MNEELHDIQWHPPFRGAIKIELEQYKDVLEYVDEKVLTKKPLQIDLLVIKKPTNVKIENPIGRIFRGINVMEYKSPTDYISIDDFYKVSAYAYILKSDANTENEVKWDDITISLVSSKVPQLAFQHLQEERGYQITAKEKGIYYLYKEKEIPIQCLILEELGPIHKWLVALTNHITVEKLKNIAADYDPAKKNEYKESIMETVLKANSEFIKNLKEDEAMSEEVLELFRPEIEAEINRRIQEVDEILKQKMKDMYKEIKERDKEIKERDKEIKDRDDKIKEMVVRLYKLNVPISQIKQATDLSEEEISDIIY